MARQRCVASCTRRALADEPLRRLANSKLAMRRARRNLGKFITVVIRARSHYYTSPVLPSFYAQLSAPTLHTYGHAQAQHR